MSSYVQQEPVQFSTVIVNYESITITITKLQETRHTITITKSGHTKSTPQCTKY